MAKNNSSQSPGLAGEFVGADAPLRQLRLPAHLIFLFLMFLLPALFGRFLFLRFILPLAHRLGIHPAVSSVLLVNVLMLFELALLLAAFYCVQCGPELAATETGDIRLADRLEGDRMVAAVVFGYFYCFGWLGGIGSAAHPRLRAKPGVLEGAKQNS